MAEAVDGLTTGIRVAGVRRVGAGRRALAVFALGVSLLALGYAAVAPAGLLKNNDLALREAAAAASGATDSLPRLCSACGPAAPPWIAHGSSISTDAAGNQLVDPRQVAASAAEAPPDRRFGVVQAYAAPYAASYAGVGWERVNFDWPSLQPNAHGAWNRAGVSGAMIGREIAAGREVVGIIGGRPRWAVDARGLPRGLYLPADDPANVWGAFVAELARRYRGRVRHWIVWNEPDVWDPHISGYTWPGSVDDFAQLQKVAYTQIKRVDPTLVVHLAATTYWWDAAYGRPLYFGRLLDALARDPAARAHHWYFDVASAHIYNVPDDVERILRIDRALMHAHGFGKPIWLVETNATPTIDGPWAMRVPPWTTTAREQAAFVAQVTSLALAAGAERVSFYKMADPPSMSRLAYPAGLVRPDGTVRPVLAAFRATTHALAGWVGATDLGITGSVRAVAVDRGARGGTLALWNTGPTPINVTVTVAAPAQGIDGVPNAEPVVVADDDTRQPAPVTRAAGQSILHLILEPGRCARDPRCNSHLGGAPLMVVASALPRLLAATPAAPAGG